MVEGDELLIGRLLGILLDNAIKYTADSGEVRVEVFIDGTEAGVLERDTGIGIAPGEQRQIFERYYQGDLRERRSQPGCGMGLSIARWIADAHRAEITLDSIPEKGSTFRVAFPLTLREQAEQEMQLAV